jgi:hypothetical protein
VLPPLPKPSEVEDLGRLCAPDGTRLGNVARLVRADDGSDWVAKGKPFSHYRPYEAANELIAWRLAKAVGLPVLDARILRCRKQMCFGTRLMPEGTFERRLTAKRYRSCVNRNICPLVLLFDAWLGNVDRHEENLLPRRIANEWQLVLIDHGSVLVHPLLTIDELADKVDAPLRNYGMHALKSVYDAPLAMYRALDAVEFVPEADIARCVADVPTELLGDQDKAVVERFLTERRRLLRELISATGAS